MDNVEKKNPIVSALLSFIPGLGSVYNGNYWKGLTYLVIFAFIIVLLDSGRGAEEVFFGIFLAGFYFFQIIESYNDAKKTNQNIKKDSIKKEEIRGDENKEENDENSDVMSLHAAITILIIGILFQLANLDILSFRRIVKLWPLLLIAAGLKAIYDSSKNNEEDKNE